MVEAALRAIGQTIAALGYRDPRLHPSGKLDLHLHHQLQAYMKEDPPPTQVKPIPLQIIHHLVLQCYQTPDPRQNAIGHMITLGFFFLLHPGEYAYTDNLDAAPFRLCDVHLLHDNVHLDALNCPEHLLDYATQLALEFNRQKNGVWGELVRLGRSNHDILCKVRAGINRLKHLRLHRAHPTTPIYKYFHRNTWAPVTTLELTQHLRSTTTILGNQVGIQPADISVWSLRSNGAMA